ncbi:MAG: pyridoxamine 5'-phosphate oxidase family protein [Candidatus Rokubacteria bacterium]|nr:pyridoxamine 5'-phosphate oxidase family protein [Candidatus Rokubacteria bacterium]
MASWSDVGREAPELAAAGWRLFKADGIPIAFLATVARSGRPRIAPVCPIFAGGDIYLSVGAHTPKKDDLSRDGRFALHAPLGREDEEFQASGRAVEVVDPTQRAAVHQAIKFGAYHPGDPIFVLDLERCFHVRWEDVGRPETRSIRRSWSPSWGGTRTTRWSLARGMEEDPEH